MQNLVGNAGYGPEWLTSPVNVPPAQARVRRPTALPFSGPLLGVERCGRPLRTPVARHLILKLQPGILPFPVLRFWGKNTMAYAGAVAIYRDLPTTTRL